MRKLAEQLGISLATTWILSLGIIFFSLAVFIRGLFFTFIDSHEIAYEYNKTTGDIRTFDRTGYFFVTPFVTSVHGIDARPMQVRIEANSRVLNAKLVRFSRNKEGVIQFVQMHGRDDYDQQKLSDILKSYAYENYMGDGYSQEALEKKYKFLEILSYGTNATAPSPDASISPSDSIKQ